MLFRAVAVRCNATLDKVSYRFTIVLKMSKSLSGGVGGSREGEMGVLY